MSKAKKKVIQIMPACQAQEQEIVVIEKKPQVCAYCRVSTELEEQQSSYQIQVEHYTRAIKTNPKWEFAGIYADEGISGTNTKKRVDFNRMIDDCMAGKIDIILTKSVSRFARNTLDCISYIRKLREKNIAVIFEKENINTLDGTGELLITILGSLAQEESRSLSTNTKWGIAKRFENGEIQLNHKRFLGYTRNQEDELVIDPDEAETVRLIFRLYLEGYSLERIKAYLENVGIKTATGKDEWNASTIGKMLSNEKYMGDALLQKTYTTDFINKIRVINNGIVPKYYVENSHEGIISKRLWNMVQQEKARRKSIRGPKDKRAKTEMSRYSSKYALSDMLVCGECGKRFRRVVWTQTHAKSVKWRCSSRVEHGTKYCNNSPTLNEEILHKEIMSALNKLTEDKDDVMVNLINNIAKVMGETEPINDMEYMDRRLEQLKAEMLALIEKNAKSGVNDSKLEQEYERISTERKEILKARNEYIENKLILDIRKQRISEIKRFIEEKKCIMTEFSNELVRQLIEQVKVISEDKIIIFLKSGIEVEQTMEVPKKYQGCGRPSKNREAAQIGVCL